MTTINKIIELNSISKINKSSSTNLISKPIINLIETGKNIKRLRIKNGLSVKDLQEIFNFTYPQAIYAWQDGKTIPTIDNLFVLSRLFNTPIEKIVITDEIEILNKSA